MKDKPLITIGITAFKVSEYLEEALDSVINQTSNHWKAILILDGGNDLSTINVFKNFDHPQFIKYSFKKNVGPYATRTKAIELCDTDWYLQLDGDDFIPHNTISILNETIHKNKNSYYIYGNCMHFDKSSSYIKYPSENVEDLCFHPLFNGASPIKKNIFNLVGGYSENLYINADWNFWLSVYEKEIKGTLVKKTIYARRNRKNNIGNLNLSLRPNIVEQIIRNHPIYFNSKKRKARAMFNVYEKSARYYKMVGKRYEAGFYARKALEYGDKSASLSNILTEEKMSKFRYFLRRLGRYTQVFNLLK